MSSKKSCSISIGAVSDQGGGVWRTTVTHYFPPALSGYDINTFGIGDYIFEEQAATIVRRWEVTGIGASASPLKQYDVQWADLGTDPGTGPSSGVNGVIAQVSENYQLSDVPTREYHQVPDHLRTQLVNTNSFTAIDPNLGAGGGAADDFLYNIKDLGVGIAYHVAPDGNDANTGLVRLEAFLTIQHAIDTAAEGDIVLVHEGTYEITAAVTCNKGIKIIGVNGAESTIIKPTLGTQIRCMYIYETKTAVVQGIQFQNGYTLLAGPGTNAGNGGGLCIWQDTGTTPSTDVGSYAIDCIFDNCYAQQYGGGVHLMDHKSAVINCTFRNCTTALGGTQGGGGISLRWGAYARNCLVYDCQSAYGSGVLCNYGVCEIHNCTIVDNTGHGITLFQGGSTGHQVYNCIVFHNSTANIGILGGAVDVQNTTANPQPSGTNNINVAPTFVDRTGNDYRLDDDDVLRDYGRQLDWHASFSDLAGQRIRYNVALGAYTVDKSVFADTNLLQPDMTAEKISYDNNATGLSATNVQEALDEVKNGYGPWHNEVTTRVNQLEDLTPAVIVTTTGADDLKNAVNAMTDGQVLEVRANGSYNPITLPAGKRLVIKAGKGFTPKIVGAGAITVQDGAAYCTVSGFICDGNTLPGSDPHGRGCCISIEHEAQASHMLFHNLTMTNVSGVGINAVVWSYHQSVSGDNYATAPALSEFSDHIAFVACHTARATTSPTEGGHYVLRGIDQLYMRDNYLDGKNRDGGNNDGRGILIQDCTNAWLEDNTIINTNYDNGEGIKIDEIGTISGYTNTGVVYHNCVKSCIEGIDIDDVTGFLVLDNKVSNCTNEGISVDDSSSVLLCGNICWNNVDGIRLESGAVAELKANVCFNNSSNNYRIENGYTVDSTNGDEMDESFVGSDSVPYDNTTSGLTSTTVQDALDEVAGGGSGEVNTASNLGAGSGVFASKVGVDLQFKSIVAGTNVSLASDATTVTVNATVPDALVFRCSNAAELNAAFTAINTAAKGGIIIITANISIALSQNYNIYNTTILGGAQNNGSPYTITFTSSNYLYGKDFRLESIGIDAWTGAAVPFRIHAGTTTGASLWLHRVKHAGDSFDQCINLAGTSGQVRVFATSCEGVKLMNAANSLIYVNDCPLGVVTDGGTVYADGVSVITGTPASVVRTEKAEYNAFTPAVGGDWTTGPTEVKAALDELAARSGGGLMTYEVVSEAGNEVTVTATGAGITAAWNVSVTNQLDITVPAAVDLTGITVVDTTRHDAFNNIIIDFGSRAAATRDTSDAGRNISNETLLLPNCRMINAANGSNLNPAIVANMSNRGEFTFGNMTGGPTVLYVTF